MRLRLDRNPTFWRRIAAHPDVEPRVMQGAPLSQLDVLVQAAGTVPLAATHGGFIFVPDPLEMDVYDLHTMFSSDGWGREVAAAAREAFRYMFWRRDMRTCRTLEQDGYYRSRPPLSHGWKPSSEFATTGIGSVRPWVLTREAWLASPVGKRETDPCPLSPPSPL